MSKAQKRTSLTDPEETVGGVVIPTPNVASTRNRTATAPIEGNRNKTKTEVTSPAQTSSVLGSMSIDADEPTEIATIATLLNYLSDNVEDVLKNREKMKKFEQLTAEVVNNHNDPALHRVVKAHGWSGKRYLRVHHAALDTQSYLRSLANLYLSQRKAYDGLRSNIPGEESSEPEKIVSFLPDILIRHLTSALVIEKSGDISCSTFLGAALLVDISGFSMFAAEKCSHGVGGLNDLHDATNGFLGHLVYIVYRYGGDVVAFAGDALICVFVDQPAPTKEELEASINDEIIEASRSFAEGMPSVNSYCSDTSHSTYPEWKSVSKKSPPHTSRTEENFNIPAEEESMSASRQRENSHMRAHRKAMDILKLEPQQSRRFSTGKDSTSSARHDYSDATGDNSLPTIGAVFGDFDQQADTHNPYRGRRSSIDVVDSLNIQTAGVIDAHTRSARSNSSVIVHLGSQYSTASEVGAITSHGTPAKHRSSDPNSTSPTKDASGARAEMGGMSRMLSLVLPRKSTDLMSPPRRRGSTTDEDRFSPSRSHRNSVGESKPTKTEGLNTSTSLPFTNDPSIMNQSRVSMLYLDKLEESQSENNSPASSSKMYIQQHQPKHPLDPDPYMQKNCCLRALECAMLLREQSAHSGTLTTHIAVSYGEMKLAILGGHNDDWVYLLNGECISELGPCLNSAGKKQVVATRRCYEYACQSKGLDLSSKIGTLSSTSSVENVLAFNSDSMMIPPSSLSASTHTIAPNPSIDQTTIEAKSSEHTLVSLPTFSSSAISPSANSMQHVKNSSLVVNSLSTEGLSPLITGDTEALAITTSEPFDFSPLYFRPSARRSNPKSASSSHRLLSGSKPTIKRKTSNSESIDENAVPVMTGAPSCPASVSAVDVSLHHTASFGIVGSTYTTFSQPKESQVMVPNSIKTKQVDDHFLIESIDSNRIPAEHPMRLKRILYKSPATVVDAAKLFVSRPVLSAIYSDSLDRTAELRQVVTMFVSLDSYSPADHKDPLDLQPFFKVVQEALHQSGGYLRQFVVDDKGCVVVAMWGVPQFSYSNNSLRGLFCGVAISRRSQQLSLKTSVGLTSGYCYCGCVGGRIRRDYAIIGDQVNMAARLMAKANGKVLMDMQLRDNLPTNIQHQLGRGEVMKLKGARGPVQPFVYEGYEIPVTDVLEDHEGQTTVLRRQVRLMLSSQLDKISNESKAADQAKQSGKQSIHRSFRASEVATPITHSVIVTVIIGLPGTGKSTAAQYFEQESRKRNIDCIKIQSRPGEEIRPYSAVRKLFLELIGVGNFREEWQQRSIIHEVVREAYSTESDEVKINAELTLEIILGLDWSEAFRAYYPEDYEENSRFSFPDTYDHDPSTYTFSTYDRVPTNTDPDNSTLSNVANRKLRLKVGDMTFYNILRSLLKNRKSVIIIEDADYCDELSWNEFHLILEGNDLQLAMLVTMRTPPSRSSSTNIHQPLNMPHNRRNFFQSSLPAHHPSNNGKDDLPTVTITRASGESVIVSIAEFDTTGLIIPNRYQGDANGVLQINKFGMLKFRPNNSYLSILSHTRCKVIEMNPLNEAEINELLQEALQIDEVDTELVMSVLEVTAGNAFWCKAIARFIRENGIEEYSRTIVRRGGNYNSLRALILNRIDRLSAEQQIVAKHASIIGDEFTLSVLKAILPNKIQTHLSQSLEALQHNGLVYCVEEGHEIIFSFQNQLIRNTIYDLTPPTDADYVHLAVAELLEYQYADDLRQYYPSLSYHYRNSVRNNVEKRDQALKFTVKAADQAISRESYADGLAFLQLAVPFADTIDEIRTLLEVVRTALGDLAPTRLTDLKNTLTRVRNSLVSQTSAQMDAAESARQSIQSQYEKLQKELYKAIDKIESMGDKSFSGDTSDEQSNRQKTKALTAKKNHTKRELLGCLGGNLHERGSGVPALVNELSYVKSHSKHRRTHMACVLM